MLFHSVPGLACLIVGVLLLLLWLEVESGPGSLGNRLVGVVVRTVALLIAALLAGFAAWLWQRPHARWRNPVAANRTESQGPCQMATNLGPVLSHSESGRCSMAGSVWRSASSWVGGSIDGCHPCPRPLRAGASGSVRQPYQ